MNCQLPEQTSSYGFCLNNRYNHGILSLSHRHVDIKL